MRSFGRDPSGLLFILLIFLFLPVLTGGTFFQRRDPHVVIAILLSFVVATTVHEFMHAYVAWRLGDDTAQRLGRITLNPMAHFEPFGFIGMVMIAFGFGAIGWGKPVPVNPNAFHYGIRRRQVGMALVAFAGPLSNIVQAAVVSLFVRLCARSGIELGDLGFYLSWFIYVNILLAAFNMIPIPPLDGHKILVGLLPNFWYPVLAPLERYGFLILFAFILVGRSAGGGILDGMIDPGFDLLRRAFINDPILTYLSRYSF